MEENILSVREFYIPPVIIFGSGASEQTGEQCLRLGVKKALIVTDKYISGSGILDGIIKSLEHNNLPWAVYNGVATEPTVDYVKQGLEVYRGNGCDFLLAIGGGSPIDTAKAIAVMVTNPGPIEDYMGSGRIPDKRAPLMAIPTTAGTGSEASMFTVITDTRTHIKMLIGSPFIVPDVAIVDPLLTLACPPGLTATVAIDALTHAIEAYVSVKAQPMSDIFSLAAIKLISGNLRRAWSDGSDKEARENTMLGALQAGIAFSNSSVALVHGMSRPIGAYFNVPHGASNAALLGVVTSFSLTGNPTRYARIAGAMGEDISGLTDSEAAEKGAGAIGRLMKDIRIPSLKELGVEKVKLEELASQMAADAIASGSPANNPRKASQEEIIGLYKLAFKQSA